MDKKQLRAETRKIVEGYSRKTCRQTADLLKALWLTGEVKKSHHLVKKEQREKIDFTGIGLDVLKSIGRETGKMAENADFLLLAELLWNEYGREGRIVSVMVLGQMVVDTPETVVPLCRELVKTSVSWEDCDNMVEGVEPLIRKEPELHLTMLDSWVEDENKWVRRCALTVVGRLPMKKPEYTAQCLDMVVPCLDDTDQDIKRATSFAIRMGARGDIEAVLTFIRTHAGGTTPGRVWVFSDVIRSMTKTFLPHFKGLLPVYETWLHVVDDPRSQESLQSAIRILGS